MNKYVKHMLILIIGLPLASCVFFTQPNKAPKVFYHPGAKNCGDHDVLITNLSSNTSDAYQLANGEECQ